MAVLVAAPMALAAPKGANNAGTIKVHDDATASPETRNEPHVSCDFWIEGFNMQDASGVLVFQAWPPTGHKQEVTPTGAGLDWTAESGNAHGNYHFLNGAYQLPAGHYKVTAQNENGTKTKSKVFWVEPCEQTPPPCASDCTPPPCTENCVPTPPTGPTPPTTQIPFFPTTGSLAMGLLGAAGSVGAVLLRRR